MGLEVFVTFSCPDADDDCAAADGYEPRIEVNFHYLHSDVRSLVGCLPCPAAAREAFHAAILRRVRPLLESLDLARAAQRLYERESSRDQRTLGHRRVHAKCLAPVLLHDACTLYAGAAANLFGGGCWFVAAAPCSRCGANWWGLTCTPPRIGRRGGLVRDRLDRALGFCWTCLARREVGLYEVARGWDCLGMPSSHGPSSLPSFLDAERPAIVGVI